MDHPFQPSLTDSLKCSHCKHSEIMHTNEATCECCPNVGPVKLFVDIAMCADCYDKELLAQANNNKPEVVDARIEESKSISEALKQVGAIDYSVQTRNDIFNAETVAIVEIKGLIDADETIKNKPYALAQMITERFNHFKKVIFELDGKKIELHNQQRAIQTYLYSLRDKLSIEEREKLRLADVDYKPTAPKLVKSTSVPKKKTFDKVAVAKCAGETGLSMALVQMLCTQKNMTPEELTLSFQDTATKVLGNESTTSKE